MRNMSRLTALLLMLSLIFAINLHSQARWIVQNFEWENQGLDGYDILWGVQKTIFDVQWLKDPTARSNGVMKANLETAGNGIGAVGKEDFEVIFNNITASKFTVDLWVPSNFPKEAQIKCFGQDQVNQNFQYDSVKGEDLTLGAWNTLSFDIQARLNKYDASKYDVKNGLIAGVEFFFPLNVVWKGSIYIDNFTLIGIPDPTAGFVLQSPKITARHLTGVTSQFDSNVRLYSNEISWEELAGGLTEKYKLYAFRGGKITDVTATGVIRLSPKDGFERGVGKFVHHLSNFEDTPQTWYYAVTTVGTDPQSGTLLETPVRDGISNTGSIFSNVTISHSIPFVTSFPFQANGDITEFRNVALDFPNSTFRSELAEDTQDSETSWSHNSVDCNFDAFVVMDHQNLYIGFDVIDDDPTGAGKAQEGDGVEVFIGFFNPAGAINYDNKPTFRVGYSINENTSGQLQINGFENWPASNVEVKAKVSTNSYTVEFKIPFNQIPGVTSYVPQDGSFIPLRLTVNDRDAGDVVTTLNPSLTLNSGGGASENWGVDFLPQTWRWQFITSIPGAQTDVENDEPIMPETTQLIGNYPNPFNPETRIQFTVAESQSVSLTVFDASGRKIKNLQNEFLSPGEYEITWFGKNDAGKNVPSGLYILRMQAGTQVDTRKMLLVR